MTVSTHASPHARQLATAEASPLHVVAAISSERHQVAMESGTEWPYTRPGEQGSIHRSMTTMDEYKASV
jgi:hypothetical protein